MRHCIRRKVANYRSNGWQSNHSKIMNSLANPMCKLYHASYFICIFSWSFGVLLYELFTMGETPYPTVQPSDMIAYLESGQRLPKPEPLCLPEMYVCWYLKVWCINNCRYELMQLCWQSDSNRRPQFVDIREIFASILEKKAVNYGYIALKSVDNEDNEQVIEIEQWFANHYWIKSNFHTFLSIVNGYFIY